jgi:hypothetical protein
MSTATPPASTSYPSSPLPPPAYNESSGDGKEKSQDDEYSTKEIEERWDRLCPKDWQTKHINFALALTPEHMREENQPGFFRGLFKKRSKEPLWMAMIFLRAKNIPRLMREGFHWSPANIIKGMDAIMPDTTNASSEVNLHSQKFKHSRMYQLKDLDHSEPEWVGQLWVQATDASFIINFDVNCLTKDMRASSFAKDWNQRRVYEARTGGKISFNAIYKDMPLSGWWI